MIGKKRVDLRFDPPPDLALEVVVTHRALDRMTIYARLRVPEVWQLEGAV
jgi:Uma2 family endonuclease